MAPPDHLLIVLGNRDPVTLGVQNQPLHMFLQVIDGVDDGMGQSELWL